MTTKRAFGQAIALWEATRQITTDDDFDALENAERVILAHRPTSLVEAANMLEVVMEQRGDGRSDGLDLRALERIVSFLREGAVGMRPVQSSGTAVDGLTNQL